jgi:hypothetical protein
VQFFLEPFFLGLRQSRGGADLDANPPLLAVVQVAIRRPDRPDGIEPVVIVEHQQEIHEQRIGLAGERRLDDIAFRMATDGAAAQEPFEIRIRREHVLHQRVELIENRLGLVLFRSGAEQSLGVDAAHLLAAHVENRLVFRFDRRDHFDSPPRETGRQA